MTEKEKLVENLVEKSKKSKDEIFKLIEEKVEELSGLVSEEGAIYIVANELGVRLDADKVKKEAEVTKIDKITEPKMPMSVIGKVIKKYDKVTFNSGGNEGCVQSILIGDETGIIRIVFWHEKTELLENLNESDIVNISNAYTRENNQTKGRIEIHYGQYSDLVINPEGVEIKTKEFTPQSIEFTKKKITDLEEGDRNIEIEGIVADFEIPRFYLGCPQCFKKVSSQEEGSQCAEHGEVEGSRVPIVNLAVDDGTSTIPVVGFRDRAEDVTKLSTAQIILLAEDINKFNDFTKSIVGSKIKIGGNVSSNTMTGEAQFLVNKVLEIEFTPSSQATPKSSPSKSLDDSKKKKKTEEDDFDLDIDEIDIDDDLL